MEVGIGRYEVCKKVYHFNLQNSFVLFFSLSILHFFYLSILLLLSFPLSLFLVAQQQQQQRLLKHWIWFSAFAKRCLPTYLVVAKTFASNQRAKKLFCNFLHFPFSAWSIIATTIIIILQCSSCKKYPKFFLEKFWWNWQALWPEKIAKCL